MININYIKLLFLKISLSLAFLLIFIGLSEIILRATYNLYSNYYTEMWRYNIKLKKMSAGTNQTHYHLPNKAFTLYGAKIQTNSLGFRADKEYLTPKPKNSKRILILGDSITLGWGVEYKNTYPQILESLLNNNYSQKCEVINSGVGNFNTKDELQTLQKFKYLKPDLIILSFYINDIETTKYPSKGEYFLKRNMYLYPFLFTKLINNSIYKKFKENHKQYYTRLYQNQKLKKNLSLNIKQIIEITKQESIPLIFLNIPELHNFQNYPFQDVNNFIENIIYSYDKINYINLLKVLKTKSAKDLWISNEDIHPNAQGHHIIAQEIYKEITRKK